MAYIKKLYSTFLQDGTEKVNTCNKLKSHNHTNMANPEATPVLKADGKVKGSLIP